MKCSSSFPTAGLAKVCLRGVISDSRDDAFGYPAHSSFLGAVFTSTYSPFFMQVLGNRQGHTRQVFLYSFLVPFSWCYTSRFAWFYNSSYWYDPGWFNLLGNCRAPLRRCEFRQLSSEYLEMVTFISLLSNVFLAMVRPSATEAEAEGPDIRQSS